MRVKFKNTPEQIELIKAMGSRDPAVSRNATEIFAAFIGPVIQQIISQAGSANLIYRDVEYDEDDHPSIPLDLYLNEPIDYITTWSQTIAGGLPTSQVEGNKEMKFSTYRLDTAISIQKKYARKSRLDVWAKAIERMSQEVLLKQERNGWAVIVKALAEASTNVLGTATRHVIQSNTDNQFILEDLSRWMTLIRRLLSSWASGTPEDSSGLTDIFLSPEMKQELRAFAYNPMNTRAGVTGTGGTPTGSTTAVPLPDSVREQIFRAAGTSEIYGVTIHELLELGIGGKYNILFGEFAGSTQYGGASFTTASDEILIGFDLTRDAFLRPLARQAESGSTFVAQPDDQWPQRSDKTGLFGSLEEGRICIDSRAVTGAIV